MTEPIPVPTKVQCAECGAPLSALTSYGVSVPVDSDHDGADFCSIGCLMDWAISIHEEAQEVNGCYSPSC